MTPLQRAMERIMQEANELYPTTNIREYNARMATVGRQAEFVIRELKFEIRKNPDILVDLGLSRDSTVL